MPNSVGFSSICSPTCLACSLHICGHVQLWLADSIFDVLRAVAAAAAEWETCLAAVWRVWQLLGVCIEKCVMKHWDLSLRSVYAVSHAVEQRYTR